MLIPRRRRRCGNRSECHEYVANANTRTAAAAVLVYVLLNDTISDAPVTIIMILGVVVVGTFPWLKLRTPKTLDV